ncbi:MAG TPA: hypothetical protein VI997_10795 [Candidatus Thermoplasmatota archaeon]|nr:hypothetical protein [Candidatus Thermoplasmatota archaeon]
MLASRLAYVAGVLLIVSGAGGGAGLVKLAVSIVLSVLGPGANRALVLGVVFVGLLLAFLASLGGVTVILGGWVVRRHSRRAGAFLIALGAGVGLLGLILHAVALVWGGGSVLRWLLGVGTSLGGVGILLSVVARRVAVRDRRRQLLRSKATH